MLGAAPRRVWREVDLPHRRPRRARRGRVRVRDLARRVRRDALRRPARDHHAAGRDLPAPRPARRGQLRPGHGREHHADGARPRRRCCVIERLRVRDVGRVLMLADRPASRSATATPSRSTASTSRSPTTRWCACSARAAAARARCSGPWPGSSRRPAGRSRGTAATSPACRRTGGSSASCSRTTRCSRTATCSATSRSGCACNGAAGCRGRRARPRRARARRAGRVRAPAGARAVGRRAATGRARPRARPRPATAHARRAARLARPGAARAPRRRAARRCSSQLGVTALFVTHDQDEAFALADRIVIMRAGAHRAGRAARRTCGAAPRPSSWPGSSASPTSWTPRVDGDGHRTRRGDCSPARRAAITDRARRVRLAARPDALRLVTDGAGAGPGRAPPRSGATTSSCGSRPSSARSRSPPTTAPTVGAQRRPSISTRTLWSCSATQ